MSTYSVLRRMIMVACACIVALAIFFGTAYANGDAVTVPLTVDCSQVPDTPAARAALAQYNLCGYGSAEGNAIALSTVWGNCGSLTLSLDDEGNGIAWWYVRITSSLALMVAASYTGWAYNNDLNTADYVAGSMPSNHPFTYAWSDVKYVLTGPGDVDGVLVTASSTLVSGIMCYNSSFPTSSTTVN